ncbi:hypothetical protein FACS1894176_00850 [Bacteroidia bacterium]|nr:hypothetical protein FACS1894176_00850 [Bacteroidia bacterium]
MPRSSDIGQGEYGGISGERLEHKLDMIESYVEKMYQRFLLRYGDIGNFSEIEFKTEILEALKTDDALRKLGIDPYGGHRRLPRYGGSAYSYLDEILDDYILQHQGRFSIHKTALVPYQNLDKYEQEFANTLLSDQGITLK